jgi:hypothetical protein
VENQGRRLEKLYRRSEEIRSVVWLFSSSCPDRRKQPFTHYLSIVYDVGSQNSRRRLSVGSNGRLMPMKPIENTCSCATKGYKNVCGCEVAK